MTAPCRPIADHSEASMNVRSSLALVAVAAAAIVALGLGLAPARTARAEAPAAWKNLQVLPKTIAKDQLKALMKAQTKALGVECDHCHEAPNMDVDTKNKKVARQMMQMTQEINEKFLKGMDDKVSCATCHRGKEKPEELMKK
jgi:hypothetical protein